MYERQHSERKYGLEYVQIFLLSLILNRTYIEIDKNYLHYSGYVIIIIIR